MEDPYSLTSNNESNPAAQGPAQMFQNAAGFSVHGSHFTHVMGNMNIHSLAPPSIVQAQESTELLLGGNTSSHSLDVPVAVETEGGSYCRQLLCRGRGFPLFVPGPQDTLPQEYRREGVAIGDVGSVTTDGIFDFFFNIYLDADDPINLSSVPDGFVPLPRYIQRDIVQQDFEPGNSVSTPRVRRRNRSDSGEIPWADFRFNCHAPCGAVLALPHGSHVEKLRNLEAMRLYAAENAQRWYEYINGPRGRGLANGSLYLVTGFEKSRSQWGMAVFQEVPAQTTFPLSFIPDADVAYRWTPSGPATTKASGIIAANGSPQNAVPCAVHQNQWGLCGLNQTVFITGFSISLGTGIWGRLFKNVEICPIEDSQLGSSGNDFVSYASQGFSFSWSPGFLGGSTSNRGKQSAGRIEDLDGVDVSEFPPISQIFHPSQVINEYLLRQFPNAKVVMSHDDDWRGILRGDGEPTAADLLHQICDRCLAMEENGSFFLVQIEPEMRTPADNFPTDEPATDDALFLPDLAALLSAEKSSETQIVSSSSLLPENGPDTLSIPNDDSFRRPAPSPNRFSVRNPDLAKGVLVSTLAGEYLRSYTSSARLPELPPELPTSSEGRSLPLVQELQFASASGSSSYSPGPIWMAGPQRTHPSTAFRKRDPHDSTVPISDTHMQPRTYTTPSRTSRKEIGPPAFFGRRSSSQPSEEEEDELSEEPLAPNATYEEKIEYKRRQNTLAARRSRKRKLMYQQQQEDAVDRLTRESEVWKTRALTLSSLLQSHGIACPDFSTVSETELLYADGHHSAGSSQSSHPSSRLDAHGVHPSIQAPSQPSDEEEDGLSEEPLAPNATHKEQFRYKRRQIRLAARHRRKRKLKHQQELEDAVERLTREEEIWKTRVQTLSNLLQSHGITYSDSHE